MELISRKRSKGGVSKVNVTSKVSIFINPKRFNLLCLLSAEEEETLLNNEDRVSNHPGGPPKSNMIKKDLLSIFDVLWRPDYNRAIIAVIVVMLAQQLCGRLLSGVTPSPSLFLERPRTKILALR
jgi:hypothetical protein